MTVVLSDEYKYTVNAKKAGLFTHREQSRTQGNSMYTKTTKWLQSHNERIHQPINGWLVNLHTWTCDCRYYIKFGICVHVLYACKTTNKLYPGQELPPRTLLRVDEEMRIGISRRHRETEKSLRRHFRLHGDTSQISDMVADSDNGEELACASKSESSLVEDSVNEDEEEFEEDNAYEYDPDDRITCREDDQGDDQDADQDADQHGYQDDEVNILSNVHTSSSDSDIVDATLSRNISDIETGYTAVLCETPSPQTRTLRKRPRLQPVPEPTTRVSRSQVHALRPTRRRGRPRLARPCLERQPLSE
jgi:hypothetical protein